MDEKMVPAEPGELSAEEARSLAEAERAILGSEVSADRSAEINECSGRLIIRIPKTLHYKLKREAEAEGVSLNQYALWKLSVDVADR